MLTHQDSFFLGRGLPNNVSLVVVDTLRCGEKRHGVKFNLLSKEITRLQGHVSLVEFAVTICILGSLSNHDDDGNKNPTNLHI